ncbi:putative gustatory receptor 94a, partial [Scaptodrosophila lebanonensis]|uniref:Gustatory receptor n=1 Tax=Drosophila lebanonensis TaxID=7225 RepID=A0A6J2T8E3_DROLE
MRLFGQAFSRWNLTGRTRLVYFLLVIMLALLTIFGLFSIRYKSQGRRRFVFSRIYLAYTMVITIAFTITYTHQMYEDYRSSQLDLRDAVKLYSYMNITVTIINFVTQMFKVKQVARLMSQVPLFDTLREFSVGDTLLRSVVTSIVKVIGFPFIIGITMFLQQQRYEPELSGMWSVHKLFPMIVSNLLNNSFYGVMIIVKAILKTLNIRLMRHVRLVECMQKEEKLKLHTIYYSMQKYCTWADEIDALSIKYRIICIHATNYTALVSLSMVLSLLCHLLGITVGFFNQYSALADTFIDGQSYDAFSALTNCVFLIISILEITLLAQLANDILVETQQTGIILQNLSLQRVDWRFRQAVDTFSLQVISIKHKIVLLGLFELNATLITDVMATVASFLLILIQTDLSHRFKMK